jgi:hypothetical protein
MSGVTTEKGEYTMETQVETLVVLDEGNTSIMESSWVGCCLVAYLPMIY